MSARRGRPPAYNREAALGAMVEMFLRLGFAATSLDDVGRATGMSRPSLFAAFGNKKAMYLAALSHFRQEMSAAVVPALTGPEPLPDSLAAFFDAAIRFYCSGSARGCLVLCTAAAEAPADDEIRAVLAEVIGEIEEQFANRIRRSAATIKASGPDPNGLAKLLTSLLIAIAIQARAGIPEQALRSYAKRSLTAALLSF